MSRELVLILPAPADLDSLRSTLNGLYKLSLPVGGLQELDELGVKDFDERYVATIANLDMANTSGSPQDPPGSLRFALREKSVDPDAMSYFWIRVSDWCATNQMLAKMANEEGAWVFAPDWSLLFSGKSYVARAQQDPAWDYLNADGAPRL